MLEKRKVLVLGMARSGYEAAKLLISKNYEVVINDINNEQNLEHIKELQGLGVQVVLGTHPQDLFDNTFEMVVKNPGIPNSHKYVEMANKLNIPVINELELGFRYFPKGVTIIGVTGTNGKTTTTSIIYDILKKASKSVYLMGNIGYPVCSFVSQLKKDDIAVMEVSDHQLCNVIDFKTNISVLTNLSEAHIDFHGSYEVYKNMKKRIFNHHTKEDIAILNLDDKDVLHLTEDIKSTKKYFSSTALEKSGCSIDGDDIYYNEDKIINVNELKIKGKYNYENIMSAVEVVKELGIDNNVIVNVLKNFGGVEHRMEYVTTIKGIEIYNNSKSTNITSTQTALSSFTQPVVLLLGGLDRGHSFEGLKEYLCNVKLIVAFGECKIRIEDFARECCIPCKVTDNLEKATEVAYNSASRGDVVLLSPACASWDQFKDFETRGNLFKECINKLSEEVG